MKVNGKARAGVVAAMLMFGSIGLFVRGIALPSSVIALVRGVVGCLFLIGGGVVMGQHISWKNVRENWLVLLLSGTAIGFNWIFLFEAYRYTTVACATLSYYFAPIFVILVSPLILGEKLTVKKAGCAAGAVAGMVLVSNVFAVESGRNDFFGVFLGLTAAVLYASVVILNKFIRNLSGLETTAVQLGVAALVLFPYTAFTEFGSLAASGFAISLQSVILLAVVGIVHTGVGYLLYFTAMKKLPAQTIAVLSYIDPVTAILLSAVLLGEVMSVPQWIGAVLILGMTWLGDRE